MPAASTSRAPWSSALAIVASLAIGSEGRGQTNAVWNGPNGNWTNAAIWSTNPFFPDNGNPGGPYSAILNGGFSVITLDANITIEQLQFNTGTIAGTNTLTLNQLFTWGNGSPGSGGTLLGAGTINANGGMAFNGPEIMAIRDGWTLNVNANSTWSDGTITLNGSMTQGSTLNIAASATLTVTGNNIAQQTGGFVSSIVNNGTFRKSTGTGTTSINTVRFANTATGTVDVQSGTLSINGGGTSTGAFNVASGATLQFGASAGAVAFNVNGGSGIAGTGTTAISGGSAIVNFNSGPYTIATALNINNSGTLGGDATVNINGLFTFAGGTVTGSGRFNANGGVQFTGTDTKFVDNGGDLNLLGASGWDNGTIRLNSGGTLTVGGGATFTATGNNIINFTAGAVPSFVNAGIFRKMTGSGTTTISNFVPFTNSGAVDVQSGTLSINGGGTSTGSLNAEPGATLQFGAGTFGITSGSGITGTGTTAINGGTVNVNVASYPIATALNLSSGTLGGTGSTEANGLFTFSGGIVSGPVNGNGGVLLTGGDKFINTGGVLGVRSAGTWDAGNVMVNGGNLSIANTGVLSATGNDTLQRTAGGAGTISNAGTFRKVTGSGTTTIANMNVNNNGMIEVQSGTLAVNNSSFFTNNGTVKVQAGTLSINSATTFTNSSSGTVDVQGGTLAVNVLSLTNNGIVQVASGATITGTVTSSLTNSLVRGRGTVDTLIMNNQSTLSPGFSAGTLTATGSVTMNAGSTYFVELDGSAPDTGYDVLAVIGAVSLSNPTLSVSLGYTPALSDVFTIITAGSIAPGNIFTGLPDGATVPLGGGFSATIQYGATFVRLINPVPEPVHVLLAGAAVLVAGRVWRRRSK